jgi:hypothetical protein
MNIFYLDSNARLAAQYHNDKHVVKMILETAQLLSTAHHILDGDKAIASIYKSTHKNHPSAVWARQSNSNYNWLYNLFCELCNEYTHRYGKVHLTDTKLRSVLKQLPVNINSGTFTQPTQAMPDEYKNVDAVTAYRAYYRSSKAHLAAWTKQSTPSWY